MIIMKTKTFVSITFNNNLVFLMNRPTETISHSKSFNNLCFIKFPSLSNDSLFNLLLVSRKGRHKNSENPLKVFDLQKQK